MLKVGILWYPPLLGKWLGVGPSSAVQIPLRLAGFFFSFRSLATCSFFYGLVWKGSPSCDVRAKHQP